MSLDQGPTRPDMQNMPVLHPKESLNGSTSASFWGLIPHYLFNHLSFQTPPVSPGFWMVSCKVRIQWKWKVPPESCSVKSFCRSIGNLHDGSKLNHQESDRRFWPFTRIPFWGYPIFDPQPINIPKSRCQFVPKEIHRKSEARQPSCLAGLALFWEGSTFRLISTASRLVPWDFFCDPWHPWPWVPSAGNPRKAMARERGLNDLGGLIAGSPFPGPPVERFE